MEYYQSSINFFVSDCNKNIAEKIKKILQVIPESCTVNINSKYTYEGLGLYIFECKTQYDYNVEFVEQICKNFNCKLVYTNIDLRDLPW